MRRVLSPSPSVTDEVSKLLRQKYDEVLREPLPDSLLALLKKLEIDAVTLSDRDRPKKATPQ
ncbi:MAG: NepR family anti-sigma factor [Methylocystis sp.]